MARPTNKERFIKRFFKEEIYKNPEQQKLTIAIANEKINWQFDNTPRTLYNSVKSMVSDLYDHTQEFSDLPDTYVYDSLVKTLQMSGWTHLIDKLYNMEVI